MLGKKKVTEDCEKMFLKAWEIVFKSHHVAGIFIIALLTTALYLTHGSYWKIVEVHNSFKEKHYSINSGCDLSLGRWVYDNTSYPLYKEEQCRFVEKVFNCKNRNDRKYQNWRWQPHHCDLPRFNASTFLKKTRGKKIVYVGDSLMRNQWESMLCLLGPTVDPSISIKDFGLLVPEYNVRINFHWSPLLVESNLDDPSSHKLLNITLRTEAIENHGRHWKDADTLIFDSYAWWAPTKAHLLWGAFGSSHAVYKKEIMSLRYFEMVMKTWSDWLELNINKTKTTVYFMSMSPIHSSGRDWGARKDQNCYGETEQIVSTEQVHSSEEHEWGTLSNPRHATIVESAIQELQKRGVKVQLINITQLSAYRKDAHPSIYGSFAMSYRRRNKAINPSLYSDCVHWCLPGVPDIWNQFLYAYIMMDSS